MRVNRYARSWGVAGLLLLLVGWLVGELLHSLTVIIVSVVAGVVSIFLAVLAVNHPRVVASAHRAAPPKARKRPNPGSGPVRRKGVQCPKKCRASTEPRESCDCACGGRLHGSEAPVTAPKKPRKPAPRSRPPGRPGQDSRVGDTWGPWTRAK